MDNPLAHLLPQFMHFGQLETTKFVLMLGLIIFAGTLGGWLFQKLKIPQVVGYIVIGIFLGASGFHVIEPRVISALDSVSTIALSFIGFLVEYRTRGPLTTTVYGIVAMDDAVALVLYTIASTIVSPIIGGKSLPFGIQLLNIFKDIFGSIALGCLFGFIVEFFSRKLINKESRLLSLTLGALFLCTGFSQIFNLDNILAAMSIGAFAANFSKTKATPLFNTIEKFTPPVYVLFFVLVGAKLNIWIITPFLGIIAIIYVLARTLGKSIGSILGAWLTKAPKTVQKYLPYCLLSQAGVAIGLSIAAGNDFPDSIGPQILLIITATTFIVQLIGPIFVKIGVTKAGECGLNVTVEDIKKNSRVNDVTWGKNHICDSESPAIVMETDSLFTILNSFSHNQNLNYVVKGNDGNLAGIISLEHLKEVMQIGDFAESMLAMDVMDTPAITCKPSTLLPEAYKLFEDYDTDAIPIIDANGEPLGILEKNIVDHYLHAQIINLNRKLEKLDD